MRGQCRANFGCGFPVHGAVQLVGCVVGVEHGLSLRIGPLRRKVRVYIIVGVGGGRKTWGLQSGHCLVDGSLKFESDYSLKSESESLSI
jgi:hypothetical protein